MDVEIDVPLRIAADHAARTGEFDGLIQGEDPSVSVAALLVGKRFHITESDLLQAADGADDNAVVNLIAFTGLLDSFQQIGPRRQPYHHDPPEPALCRIQFFAHSGSPVIWSVGPTNMSGKYALQRIPQGILFRVS